MSSSKMGRPRTNFYVPIAEFVQRWKVFEAQYHSIRKQYQLFRVVAYSFEHVVHPIVRVVGTIRSAWGEEPYLGEKSRNGKPKMTTFKWRTIATEAFMDAKTGQIDQGDSVIVDLNHDPPRLRILLTNGKRIEAPLRCPECPKTTGPRPRSEAWKDQDVLFIEDVPVNYKTKDSYEARLCCLGNHINWKVCDVEKYLRELGLR